MLTLPTLGDSIFTGISQNENNLPLSEKEWVVDYVEAEKDPDSGVQVVLRPHRSAGARPWNRRGGRPKWLRQVEHPRWGELGARRAEREDAARRQDGGRNLRRDARPETAGHGRGF